MNGRERRSDQGGSLYRITPGQDAESAQVEKIELGIGQAHGLLYAFGSVHFETVFQLEGAQSSLDSLRFHGGAKLLASAVAVAPS